MAKEKETKSRNKKRANYQQQPNPVSNVSNASNAPKAIKNEQQTINLLFLTF